MALPRHGEFRISTPNAGKGASIVSWTSVASPGRSVWNVSPFKDNSFGSEVDGAFRCQATARQTKDRLHMKQQSWCIKEFVKTDFFHEASELALELAGPVTKQTIVLQGCAPRKSSK